MTSDPHGPVVIGMDGSVEAARAADYGAWEAKRRGVPLRLVFAHQPTPMWGPGILIADDYAWDRDWIRDTLIRAEKHVTSTHPEATVQSSVVCGSAAFALVEESRQASLVVLGTRASGGLMGHLSGSVAAQVATHAHTPVIVLRPGDDLDPVDPDAHGRVLVGLDGSLEAQEALAFAVDEAVARGVELDAVYVWNVLEVRDMGPIIPDGYDAAEEQEKALRLLTEATEGWSDRYPDLTVNRRLVHGLDPVEAIARESDGAGLVVVGSRGHGGFLGLRLGSTVDGLIRYANAPVAVVRGTAPVS
jgi:nucleotide-binding universal stress UspA family protein